MTEPSTAHGLPQPGATAQLILGRRTINRFRPEPPPRELVREAMDLARWAPNHHLTEPWHFYWLGRRTQAAVVDLNTELVARSKGEAAAAIKRERWAAMPGWLVVTCERSDDPLRQQEDYAACCCAVHNMALYLWSAGVGMKWTTGAVIREPAFHDLLWIDPDLESVVGLFWYGYPDEAPVQQRKDLSSRLVELP